MCKIMVLKGIQDSEKALEFMKAVAPNMSIANTDGIGYAAINSQNKLFAEKWHNNKQFLDTETVIDKDFIETMAPYQKRLPELKENYKAYGEVTRNDLRTVTMHTRYATCGKTFENTHPFVDNDMSLIHNGVISNAFSLGLNKISTCDSENALQLYNNNLVSLENNPDKLQEFLNQMRGYWAFAFLAKNGNGDYLLDIVREGAIVYWANIPELGNDCMVFATTKEIIETGVKALNLPERANIYLLPEYNYHRFNAVTGEFIDNYLLAESVMNKKTYYPTYNNREYSKSHGYGYGYGWGDYYDDDDREYYSKSTSKTTEEKTQTKLNDDDMPGNDRYDEFFDINEPLVDRLYDFDELNKTNYAASYEDMPQKLRGFIVKKELEDYIDFIVVLEMIEAYQKTSKTSDAYKVYQKQKTA